MKAAVKKLASLVVMLIFTAFGFVVLVFSVLLMAGESLLSAVLSPGKIKKNNEDSTESSMNSTESKYSPTRTRDAS